MQLFGLISLLVAVFFGVWLFFGRDGNISPGNPSETANYNDFLEAARAIPGAPGD